MRSGAMALFGEKYGDQVRVVSVGDWARELCGGTHAGRSGQLGVVKLLGESSIGSGVRRVEALVGADAYRFLAREHVLVAQLTEALKARPEELPERVDDIVERLRAAEKEIEQVRVGQLLAGGRPARGGRRRTSTACAWSPTAPTAPAGATCARWRSTSAAGCRQEQPGAVVRDRRQGRQGRGRGRGQRRGPRPRASAPTTWSAAVGPLVGGRAAARTTSPRAAAPTPRASTRRWRSWRPRSPRARARRPDAARRTARDRPRGRPDRRRPQRPVRVPRHARSRRCAAARATWPGSRGSCARRRPSRSSSGCPARSPAGRARRRSRSASSRPGWPPRGRPVAGAAARRAADHGVGGGYAARPGTKGAERRAVVDQAAAVLILQHALDTERATGRAPGEIVDGDTESGES